MNNAGGALNFNATLNLNEWRRNIDQMRRDILGLNQLTQNNTRQMDSAFRNLSVGIASYFSVTAVKHFINELITVRGEFQQMENAIETITGSTSVMNNLMDEWKELTLRSPFRLSEIGQAGKQLLAYGIEVGKVTHDIEMLGNVAAGVSAPIGDIAYVYGTLKTQGRAYTRDILQFTMRGIPIMGELAKVMGVNVSELKALIEAGKVGFPEVEKAMNALTSEGGKFNNLIGKQATTLTGSVNRLKHEFELMLNDIGKANEGILKGGIDVITYLVEHYEQVNKALLTLIETYGAYRAALIVTGILQSRMATPAIIQGFANLIKVLRGATVAQEALNAASLKNPYVLLATIIAALIAVAFNYRQELGELLGIIEEQTAAQKMQEEVMNEYHLNFAKGVSQTKASINELINIIRNESSTMEMRKTAYEKLIKIDKTFIGVIDGQYRATTRLGDALQYVTTKIDAFAMAQAKASASRKILEESFEEQFKRDALKVQVDNAETEAKKWRKLADDAEKSGKASLEYLRNAYSAEKQRDKLLDQLEKQRKVANDKTSVSNAIIRSNNKEIDQKTKVLNQLREEVRLGKDNGEILALKKKQIESLEYELSGFKPQVLKTDEIDKSVEGWAERIKAQIDALEAEAQKAPNQQAYLKIQARIKALNELLHPKQESQRQWAEVLPEGSIKELQRRVQLYTDAIETAVNGQVRLRRLDKYGQDKDKKGNPYYTGEVISTEEAGKRLAELNEQINDRQYKTLQERVEGAKQQWSNYSKVVEFYGKKIADEQYKDLFNGSQNYLQYLEKEINLIEQKQDAGGILSKDDKSNLIFLRNELNLLNGIEDPFETFKRSIDDAIKKLPSLADQLDFLQKAEESAFEQAGGNTDEFLKKKVYFAELTRNALQQQKDSYSQFLVEKESFESRKLAIEKKYDNIRSELNKNKDLSDPERTRLTGEANKSQAKEISEMSLELFQKTDLWVKAFGDLSKIGPRTLEKMRKGFKDFLSSEKAKSLTPEQLKTVQDTYINLDNAISSRDPFKAIGLAIDRYIQKRRELNDVEKKSGRSSDAYIQKLEETRISVVDIVETTGAAAKAMVNLVGSIGDAFGSLSDDLKQTLSEVQQLIDGIVNAVAGYYSGNYGQMISGIVQIVGAMGKLLSGDAYREKQIKSWQRSVEDLKTAYSELQKQIERTAGEASLAANRGLVENLEEQKRLLAQMRDEEQKKKKVDQDKITSYNSQISQINEQIESVMDSFKKSITTTDFKDLSESLANALVEAFSKGEDAAQSFEKIVDDVMRNAVASALKVKILEPAVKEMVDKLYSSLGFGNGNANANDEQIAKYQQQIKDLEDKIKTAESATYYSPENTKYVLELQAQKQKILDLIGALKAQMASTPVGGTFDGLTPEERDKIKAMGEEAMKKYTEALKQYQDLFGQSAENAQGLKGDIKGITEKTAGALEGQINAMRIMQAEALKRSKESFDVLRNQLLVQTQIEMNTRPLKGIYDEIKALNSKVKSSLAGIP